MSRYQTGLVVGKFSPLHFGHELVIRAALARCERVVILSYSRPEFPGCEAARRAAWLGACFPEAIRVVLDAAQADLPTNDASDDEHRAFAAEVIRVRTGRRIDAIFSSEAYGPGFALDLARRQDAPVVHVAVDGMRSQAPVSGTALRQDVHGLRRFLPPVVYASFVQRIVLLGGESTGKSTLAAALADALDTIHVSEYGRELWVQRAGKIDLPDMAGIAREQIRREETAVRSPGAHRYVVCDTSPLTTLLYSLDLFGRAGPELSALSARQYDCTVLCDDDIPFVQDGTRRDPAFRTGQQTWYRERLAGRPYLVTRGPLADRVRELVAELNKKSG